MPARQSAHRMYHYFTQACPLLRQLQDASDIADATAFDAVSEPSHAQPDWGGWVNLISAPRNTGFPGHSGMECQNRHAFAALRKDGSVVTWGQASAGGDSSPVADLLNGPVKVVQIFSSHRAFAALREDGSVVAWGDPTAGGDNSALAEQGAGRAAVRQIFQRAPPLRPCARMDPSSPGGIRSAAVIAAQSPISLTGANPSPASRQPGAHLPPCAPTDPW